MAADAWTFYDSFREYVADGSIDLDNDTFKCILVDSTDAPDSTNDDAYADITGELATANGYTQGGVTLGTVTWTRSGATVTFDSDDAAWTASGGSITARYAVIYDDTSTSPFADLLVCWSLLDNTPADVTVTDGNTLTIQMNASGIFTLS